MHMQVLIVYLCLALTFLMFQSFDFGHSLVPVQNGRITIKYHRFMNGIKKLQNHRASHMVLVKNNNNKCLMIRNCATRVVFTNWDKIKSHNLAHYCMFIQLITIYISVAPTCIQQFAYMPICLYFIIYIAYMQIHSDIFCVKYIHVHHVVAFI